MFSERLAVIVADAIKRHIEEAEAAARADERRHIAKKIYDRVSIHNTQDGGWTPDQAHMPFVELASELDAQPVELSEKELRDKAMDDKIIPDDRPHESPSITGPYVERKA